MIDTLIKNGLVVTGDGKRVESIGIDGEKIVGLYQPGTEPEAREVIDATGLALCNAHLVPTNGQISVSLHDGRELKAKLLSRSRSSNVALIRVEAPPGTALPWRRHSIYWMISARRHGG